eukprot:GHVN01007157.1.p1 GENE.GHVN01007157.1~~GHVN01007157.1.p1  ORF type:complete len:670 (+),score=19.64 GHVN01007157.1:125-2011(+)
MVNEDHPPFEGCPSCFSGIHENDLVVPLLCRVHFMHSLCAKKSPGKEFKCNLCRKEATFHKISCNTLQSTIEDASFIEQKDGHYIYNRPRRRPMQNLIYFEESDELSTHKPPLLLIQSCPRYLMEFLLRFSIYLGLGVILNIQDADQQPEIPLLPSISKQTGFSPDSLISSHEQHPYSLSTPDGVSLYIVEKAFSPGALSFKKTTISRIEIQNETDAAAADFIQKILSIQKLVLTGRAVFFILLLNKEKKNVDTAVLTLEKALVSRAAKTELSLSLFRSLELHGYAAVLLKLQHGMQKYESLKILGPEDLVRHVLPRSTLFLAPTKSLFLCENTIAFTKLLYPSEIILETLSIVCTKRTIIPNSKIKPWVEATERYKEEFGRFFFESITKKVRLEERGVLALSKFAWHVRPDEIHLIFYSNPKDLKLPSRILLAPKKSLSIHGSVMPFLDNTQLTPTLQVLILGDTSPTVFRRSCFQKGLKLFSEKRISLFGNAFYLAQKSRGIRTPELFLETYKMNYDPPLCCIPLEVSDLIDLRGYAVLFLNQIKKAIIETKRIRIVICDLLILERISCIALSADFPPEIIAPESFLPLRFVCDEKHHAMLRKPKPKEQKIFSKKILEKMDFLSLN